MERRTLIRSSIAASLGVAAGIAPAAPKPAYGQGLRTLRFVPQADTPVLDPLFSPGSINRNHGFLVFDTLYGVDEQNTPQPQMIEGHVVDNDGLTWTMTLRDGLLFHDGQPVRARDAVASLRRWAARDAFGVTLFGVVDELSAPDDRTLRWRLKTPFPNLPLALGKVGSIVAFIMPERVLQGDPAVPVKEIIGSGPFRFQADEHVPGARLVYTRFADYAPRPSGVASQLAGPKLAYFDRVEWIVIPDPATAAGALQQGEVDWVEQPLSDLLPTLRRQKNLTVGELDPFGYACMLRFNHLQPPFDNVAVRRAVLSAVNQQDFMSATAGDDKALWRDGVGFFTPGSIMANDAGMTALAGPRGIDAARKTIVDAGYAGASVVLIGAADIPTIAHLNEVGADLLKQLGFKVDYRVMDWSAMLLRMANRNPPDRGGWNAFCVHVPGVTQLDPSAHSFLRAQGDNGIFGWPRSPRLEELRSEWFYITDDAGQKRLGAAMQTQAFEDVPYAPLGVFYAPTAYKRELTGMLKGLPLFWNIRRP